MGKSGKQHANLTGGKAGKSGEKLPKEKKVRKDPEDSDLGQTAGSDASAGESPRSKRYRDQIEANNGDDDDNDDIFDSDGANDGVEGRSENKDAGKGMIASGSRTSPDQPARKKCKTAYAELQQSQAGRQHDISEGEAFEANSTSSSSLGVLKMAMKSLVMKRG